MKKKMIIYILLVVIILLGVTTLTHTSSEFEKEVSCVNQYLAQILERDSGIITETLTTKSLNHSTVFTVNDTAMKRVIQYHKNADLLEYWISKYDMLNAEKLMETEVSTAQGYQLIFDGMVIENSQTPPKNTLIDFLDESLFHISKEDVSDIVKSSTAEHEVYRIELESNKKSVTDGIALGYQFDNYTIDISYIYVTIYVNRGKQQVESLIHQSQITYEVEGTSDVSEKIISYEFT